MSLNTELPMDSHSNPKGEVTHYFHFYGDMDDDVSHRVLVFSQTQLYSVKRLLIMGKGILMQA